MGGQSRTSNISLHGCEAGQLSLIKHLLFTENLDIEADTVDYYVGEEKKVVILSLVSSQEWSGFQCRDGCLVARR